MKSKLLQRKSSGLKNLSEGLDRQQKNTVIAPGEGVPLSPVSEQLFKSFNRIAARHGTGSTRGVGPSGREQVLR
jgi:hypothetical protein